MEEHVLHRLPHLLHLDLAAVHGLEVGHRQREADRYTGGRRADGVDGPAVALDEDVVGLVATLRGPFSGREDAASIAVEGDDVRLVDRAGGTHHVGQVAGGARAEAGEALGRDGVGPPTRVRHPPGAREVVEGDDGLHAKLPAALAHGPVVVEGRLRELALLGLDAAPLQREAIAAKAQVGKEAEVV